MGQGTEEQLTTTPDDIEATRANLTRDIDELSDKLSPGRVVERRRRAARTRIDSVRDRMMGSASSSTSSARSAVSDTASSATDGAQGAVHAVSDRAQGNPLAAGLVAFGAGMLISALIPASEAEAHAAQRTIDTAKEHGQPIVDEAKSVGQEMGQDLKESAAQAAEEVKGTAQQGVENVKQDGQSSAQTVKNDATS